MDDFELITPRSVRPCEDDRSSRRRKKARDNGASRAGTTESIVSTEMNNCAPSAKRRLNSGQALE
jgi:hypothetical protein